MDDHNPMPLVEDARVHLVPGTWEARKTIPPEVIAEGPSGLVVGSIKPAESLFNEGSINGGMERSM